MKKKGATLIELLVAIAILGIIASIVVVKIDVYIKRAEQVKVKNDAVEVLKLAYEQRATFGASCIADISEARVITILHPSIEQSMIPLPLENVDEVGYTLGWATTIQQLEKIVKMPVDKIPIEDGRIRQIYGRADLS